MIEIGKTYRTRDGREVRIYADDGSAPYPIHGAVNTTSGWLPRTWTRCGKNFAAFELHGLEDHDEDLIEVKPKRKLTVYINVYEGKAYFAYGSKLDADIRRTPNCIAFLTREIEYEEGEGL